MGLTPTVRFSIKYSTTVVPSRQPRNAMIFTARRYDMCLSVSPSQIGVLYQYCAKPRIRQITPYDSPGSVIYLRQRPRRNSNGSLPTGTPYSLQDVRSACFVFSTETNTGVREHPESKRPNGTNGRVPSQIIKGVGRTASELAVGLTSNTDLGSRAEEMKT